MLFVHTVIGNMERTGFMMQFSFVRPHMPAFDTAFTAVCKSVEKIDHMLFGDRHSFCTVRMMLTCCSHCVAP